MPRLAILTALSLAGCATTNIPPTAPSPVEQAEIAATLALIPRADVLEVSAAVITEIGARFRCPRNAGEYQILVSARITFDLLARPRIKLASAAVVDELRARTDVACGVPA